MRKIIVFWVVLLLSSIGTWSYAEFDMDPILGDIQIHGFISQGFLESEGNNFYADTKDGTFQFNEFGINFATDLTDRLRTSIQLFSRDIGDIGNNEIHLDLAYADYRWKDWLGFRVGKLKVNYGLYNETRDIDMLRTSVLLPQSIYSETLRDVYHSLYGIEIYGHLPLAFLGSLSYQIQAGEKDITPNSGLAKFFEEDALPSDAELVNFELKEIVTMGFDWETPLSGLHCKWWMGAYHLEALLKSTQDLIRDSQTIPAGTEFSSELENKFRVILSTEYIWRDLVVAAELQGEVDNLQASLTYYLSLSYRFTDWLEIGAYYSEAHTADIDYIDEETFDIEEEDGEPDYTELVLTTRFDFNEFWTFKIEGHFVEGDGAFSLQDNPEGLEQESFLLAVKTTFNF